MHSPHTEEWTLRIRYAQKKDSGIYECQISTTPPIGHPVLLHVVGKSIFAWMCGGRSLRYEIIIYATSNFLFFLLRSSSSSSLRHVRVRWQREKADKRDLPHLYGGVWMLWDFAAAVASAHPRSMFIIAKFITSYAWHWCVYIRRKKNYVVHFLLVVVVISRKFLNGVLWKVQKVFLPDWPCARAPRRVHATTRCVTNQTSARIFFAAAAPLRSVF